MLFEIYGTFFKGSVKYLFFLECEHQYCICAIVRSTSGKENEDAIKRNYCPYLGIRSDVMMMMMMKTMM